MSELMVKVEDVYKEYRLGAIGGTTLRDEIKRKTAKMMHKEDPTKKIGQEDVNIGEKFLALNGISFEVKKGEALGIIGHNGAGKSTLLKLITRITAPTKGEILLNGRIASMLEVGTGFHPELTGRENVYLNGAILGMTKKEIDAKMEQIIDFSEVRQFIDTPVKRYSSGMYVKLAFSVAAHLDSEIMIMDEVLAVGDVAFQNKCIKKMREVADSGRTVLYVSHNMSTIRGLCDRCIVLEKGKKIFDGDVEKAIICYTSDNNEEFSQYYDFSNTIRKDKLTNRLHINWMEVLNNEHGMYIMGDHLRFKIGWHSNEDFSSMKMRIGVFTEGYMAVSVFFSEPFSGKKGDNTHICDLDISNLCPGKYRLEIIFLEIADDGRMLKHDRIEANNCVIFEVAVSESKPVFQQYNISWGFVDMPTAKVERI